MSNKSRGNRPNPIVQGFVDSVKNAAEKARAEQEANEGQENPSQEPVGTLPLPSEQETYNASYVWTWEPILDTVVVRASMEIIDESWSVSMNCVNNIATYHPDDARKIGEALIAAWRYQYIWKDGFADFALNKARKPQMVESVKYDPPVEPKSMTKKPRKAVPPKVIDQEGNPDAPA